MGPTLVKRTKLRRQIQNVLLLVIELCNSAVSCKTLFLPTSSVVFRILGHALNPRLEIPETSLPNFLEFHVG